MPTGLEGCLPGTEFSRSSDLASGRHLQGETGSDSGVASLLLSSKDRGRTEAWGPTFFPLNPTTLRHQAVTALGFQHRIWFYTRSTGFMRQSNLYKPSTLSSLYFLKMKQKSHISFVKQICKHYVRNG